MNRYEQCGCGNPYLWNARVVVLPGTNQTIFVPLCNQSNHCYVSAIYTFLSSSSHIEQYCHSCSQQCLTTDFIIQKSFLNIGLDWQMANIKRFVENSNITLPANWSTTWQEHIQQNYLALNVILETDIVERNIQTAMLTMVNAISNVGGQTGLWIGISFLSVIELIEMTCRLVRYECHITRSILPVMSN